MRGYSSASFTGALRLQRCNCDEGMVNIHVDLTPVNIVDFLGGWCRQSQSQFLHEGRVVGHLLPCEKTNKGCIYERERDRETERDFANTVGRSTCNTTHLCVCFVAAMCWLMRLRSPRRLTHMHRAWNQRQHGRWYQLAWIHLALRLRAILALS